MEESTSTLDWNDGVDAERGAGIERLVKRKCERTHSKLKLEAVLRGLFVGHHDARVCNQEVQLVVLSQELCSTTPNAVERLLVKVKKADIWRLCEFTKGRPCLLEISCC